MICKKTIALLSLLTLSTASILPFRFNNKEDIIKSIEEALASKDTQFQLSTISTFADSVVRIFSDEFDTNTINNQDKEKIVLFLKEGMTGPFGSIISSYALHIISQLVKVKVLTAQDKKDIMPILMQAMKSTGSSNADSIFNLISNLATKKMLTIEDMKNIMPTINAKQKNANIFAQINLFSALAEANLLKAQDRKDIIPMLEPMLKKDFTFASSPFDFESSVQTSALRMISNLAVAKIVSTQEIMPLLKKGVKSENEAINKNTLSVIDKLAEAKIFTAENKKQLLS